MDAAGLKLTVNSDDPAMFVSDLANEYVRLHREMGLGLGTLKEMALNGIDASWTDDATKATWRREWAAEIDALFASVNGGQP